MGNLSDLVQFSIVDCDSYPTGFRRKAYERARPRGCGMVNETGSDIRV